MEDFERLTLFAAEIQDKIKILEEQYKEIKNEILELTDEYDTHTFGDVQITVAENKILNKKRGVEKYGDKVCTMQFDTALAKKILTGDQYADLYDYGADKVTIRHVKEV